MSDPVLKVGVLSTANIVKTVLVALKRVPTCTVTAVASRNITRAEEFAKAYDIPTFCDYEGLLIQPVDAIYIPLPTALAPDWAIRCARAGKHLLVEKPFASAEDLEQILTACRENNVLFMDATHFVHAKRSAIVRQKLNDGAIGDIKRVIASFSFPMRLSGNIRADPSLEPMGALGDLGWYTVRSAVTYLGVERTASILSVSCEGKYHPKYQGVIESAEGIAVFGTGKEDTVSLVFACDQNCSFDQSVTVYGTTGRIEIPGFIVPYNQTDLFEGQRRPETYTTNTELVITKNVSGVDAAGDPTMMFPTCNVEVVEEEGDLSQPAAMFMAFSRMILQKDTATAHKYAQESLQTQKILDMAFKEIKK